MISQRRAPASPRLAQRQHVQQQQATNVFPLSIIDVIDQEDLGPSSSPTATTSPFAYKFQKFELVHPKTGTQDDVERAIIQMSLAAFVSSMQHLPTSRQFRHPNDESFNRRESEWHTC